MENSFNLIVAAYIDRVGVDMATWVAKKKIFIKEVDNNSVGVVKFHLAVLEYLYCEDENVLKSCVKESGL